MKRITSIIALAVFLSSTFLYTQTASAQYNDRISFQTFYDELSPYGYWFNDPDYGYVWSPDVGKNFRPYYTNGHWSMTQYGNTWVSNYDWGWAPFHYGRWTYDNSYGWLWIPGTEWAPAWVTWRGGGGYYGWAPLGPGSSYNYAYDDRYYVPDYWWVFIPNYSIYSSNYYSCWHGPRFNFRFMYRTNVMHNNYNNYYACGPYRQEVEHCIGRNITVFNLRNERGFGQHRMGSNEISLYQPTVNHFDRNNRSQETPRNIRQFERPINKQEIAGLRNDVHTNSSNMPTPMNNRNDFNNRNGMTDGRVSNDKPVFENNTRPNFNNQMPDRQPDNSFGRNDSRSENNNTRQQNFDNRNNERPIQTPQNNQEQSRPNFATSDRPQPTWHRPEPQRMPEQTIQPRDVRQQERPAQEPPRQMSPSFSRSNEMRGGRDFRR